MEISWTAIIAFITGLVIFISTGITLIAGSFYFLTITDHLAGLIISQSVIIPTLVLGFIILLSGIPGTLGGWRPIQNKLFLKLLAWIIVLAIIAELVIGLDMWMQTVTPRQKFFSEWAEWPVASRAYVQKMGHCCGYTNSTDRIIPAKGCHTNNGVVGCADFLIGLAKTYYIDIYTTLFVFIMLDFVALLATAVLIEVRNDQERYEKGLLKLANK